MRNRRRKSPHDSNRPEGLGGRADLPAHRDLRDIVGTWEEDPALEEALEDQRRVNPEAFD